ncbi:MAG: selenium metabolism-associated LysR family transcriptional regulator [Schaedlerella sp.]|nr:selenium metabolism-associated LysR family transcriptional regulator [Schaedlerella sp.]
MNLKQIEAFVLVAEKGSFSETAKALFLTQPTVSAHVSELEKELNLRLFVRDKKRVALTEDGKNFYEYAKQVTLLMEQIEEKFLAKEEEDSNAEIVIAASSVPAQYLLAEIMFRFRLRYPHRQFVIKESDSAGVAEMVKMRQADIGFTGAKVSGKRCKYIPFYKDELVVITPNEERYREKQKFDSVSDWIEEEPLVLREEGSGTRKEALKILEKMGIEREKLNIVASMGSTETVKQSVAMGMGISVLSALAVQDVVSSGKVLGFPLGANVGVRDIYVVYNKDFGMTPTVKNFLRVMEKLYPKCRV